MAILWRRLMRRLGGWVQMIGRRIEDKGYIAHDTSKDYNLGRGFAFVKKLPDGEWVKYGTAGGTR